MRVSISGSVRALSAATLLSRAAFAANVSVEGCPETLESALPAVVELEIDVLLRERGPTRNAPDHVAIRCSSDRVFVEVTSGPARRESNLDLAQLAPEHRARAVALATAELVDALSPRDPAPVAAPKPAKAEARPPTPPDDRAFATTPPERAALARPTLGAGVLAEWLGAPKTWLWGARLALGYPLGSVVVPSFSLDGTLGDSASSSARVRAETLAAGAHLYLGAATRGFRWQVGPGARLGWARLTGHPRADAELDGESLGGAWGGPELRARVATEPPAAWSPAFALELGAGYVALPVRGLVDGAESVFALEGAWLSASAQVGLAL